MLNKGRTRVDFFRRLTGGGRHLSNGDFFFSENLKKSPREEGDFLFRPLTEATFFHPHDEDDFFFSKYFLPSWKSNGASLTYSMHLNTF